MPRSTRLSELEADKNWVNAIRVAHKKPRLKQLRGRTRVDRIENGLRVVSPIRKVRYQNLNEENCPPGGYCTQRMGAIIWMDNDTTVQVQRYALQGPAARWKP